MGRQSEASGADQDTYDPSMECVSCASCTTNGLAPAVRVLHEKPLSLIGLLPIVLFLRSVMDLGTRNHGSLT